MHQPLHQVAQPPLQVVSFYDRLLLVGQRVWALQLNSSPRFTCSLFIWLGRQPYRSCSWNSPPQVHETTAISWIVLDPQVIREVIPSLAYWPSCWQLACPGFSSWHFLWELDSLSTGTLSWAGCCPCVPRTIKLSSYRLPSLAFLLGARVSINSLYTGPGSFLVHQSS